MTIAPLVDAHEEILIRTYATSGDEQTARRRLEGAVRLFREELGL